MYIKQVTIWCTRTAFVVSSQVSPAAATVQAQPQLSIGPESADVFVATISPLAEGRARIATALADGRSLNYTLGGTVDAGPEDGKPRSYKIKLNSALTPVPGLPGVLR